MTSSSVHLRVFVQARMSSTRFPGKVLAPFRGRPLITHVLDAASAFAGSENVVLLTSTDVSDDPLALYVEAIGISVFRGPLDNVLERFQCALRVHPAEWVMRICGDSPFISARLMAEVATHCRSDVDVVTTVMPRTFPKGQGIEILQSRALLNVPLLDTTPEDQEHVTPWFYRNRNNNKIINIESSQFWIGYPDTAVDTLDDHIIMTNIVINNY